MKRPITSAHFEVAAACCRDSLLDSNQPDSERVGAGLTLLQLIGLRENPGRFELPHPEEHQETSDVWDALYEPLERLAAFAESRGIDSTELRQIYMARYFHELEAVTPLVDRLELIESGPLTGNAARFCARVRGLLMPIRKERIGPPSPPNRDYEAPDALVTLDQAAAIISKKKRTMERYLQDGQLPRPDIEGGGGRAHQWYWSNLRPALLAFRHDLPRRFPTSRFVG